MRFEIYFPSRDKDGKELEAFKRFECFHKVHESLLKFFTGYTKIPAHGMYHGNDGKTVSEEIFVFVVYTLNEDKKGLQEYLKGLATDIKNELNQSAVIYTINNDSYFV